MPVSYLRAFSISAVAHGAVFLVLTFTIQRAVERETSPSQAATDNLPVAQLVWLADPGEGGGGGGGNQMRESPRKIQRPGQDALSVPSVRTPISVDSAPDPVEPTLEQTIAAPVLPLASAALALPGAIDATSLTTVSLGPGGPDGAGSGDRRGIGDGPGNGLGRGRLAGTKGPNGGGAKLVLPTVLRDVKPHYTAEAMRARVEGAVLIRAVVQADGTVRDVQVLRSLDPVFGLDQAAVNAARQWLFRPGLMAGLPVPVAVTIELSFNLR